MALDKQRAYTMEIYDKLTRNATDARTPADTIDQSRKHYMTRRTLYPRLLYPDEKDRTQTDILTADGKMMGKFYTAGSHKFVWQDTKDAEYDKSGSADEIALAVFANYYMLNTRGALAYLTRGRIAFGMTHKLLKMNMLCPNQRFAKVDTDEEKIDAGLKLRKSTADKLRTTFNGLWVTPYMPIQVIIDTNNINNPTYEAVLGRFLDRDIIQWEYTQLRYFYNLLQDNGLGTKDIRQSMYVNNAAMLSTACTHFGEETEGIIQNIWFYYHLPLVKAYRGINSAASPDAFSRQVFLHNYDWSSRNDKVQVSNNLTLARTAVLAALFCDDIKKKNSPAVLQAIANSLTSSGKTVKISMLAECVVNRLHSALSACMFNGPGEGNPRLGWNRVLPMGTIGKSWSIANGGPGQVDGGMLDVRLNLKKGIIVQDRTPTTVDVPHDLENKWITGNLQYKLDHEVRIGTMAQTLNRMNDYQDYAENQKVTAAAAEQRYAELDTKRHPEYLSTDSSDPGGGGGAAAAAAELRPASSGPPLRF